MGLPFHRHFFQADWMIFAVVTGDAARSRGAAHLKEGAAMKRPMAGDGFATPLAFSQADGVIFSVVTPGAVRSRGTPPIEPPAPQAFGIAGVRALELFASRAAGAAVVWNRHIRIPRG
mmetsp:Transcript_19891/g.44265  ORF Transcript_19891/g.44265 Transcript_19891/m.44265 type:complete len:118 (+) Transcript_19891:145-498(+)